MIKPLVSVIIVSYNTKELTLKSIEHVYASTGFKPSDLEVIVVDNHSSDGTVASLTKHFPAVRVIANKTNQGFGSGNNQAAKLAQGEYLLLLNTDAFLDQGTLETLYSELKTHQEYTAIGPKYCYKDQSFQQSAGYFPLVSRVIGWMWGLDKLPFIKLLFPRPYHLYDSRLYLLPRSVDWLMGACILISRQDYLSIGGFDEGIFMYGEEIELFLRLKQSTGKTNLFTPSATITHLGSASTHKAGASRLVNELQGIEYLYNKHYPSLLWIIRFILYTGVIMRIAIFSLIPSRRGAAVEYQKFFKHS